MKCPACNTEVTGKFCRSCGSPMPTVLAGVCPACGTTVRLGAKFCPQCAAPLARSVSGPVAERCQSCGEPLKPGAKFCKSCGKQISRAASAPTVTPALTAVPILTHDQAPPSRQDAPAPSTTSPVPIAVMESQPEIRPAPQPLPVSHPPTQASRKPQTTKVAEEKPAATKPSLWAHKGLVLGAVAVLMVVGAGSTYWFVLRKPAAHIAPIIEGPLASQPVATPQSPSTGRQPAAQPAQAAQTEPQESANETQNVTAATPAPLKPNRNASRPTPVQASQPYEQAHQNAEQALYTSRFLEPAEDSALFWARKAKSLGDPAADVIEQQVFDKQIAAVQGAIQAHDYNGARAQVTQLTQYFPGRPELQQIPSTIQQEEQKYNQQLEQQRRQAELEAQTKHFQFRHRHVTAFAVNSNSAVSFCTGTLTVMPDGTVRYDCSISNDPQGRCDHVTFPPGSLKEAKLKGDGSLHLASRQSGNFDFYGDANNVQQALSVISPLVKR